MQAAFDRQKFRELVLHVAAESEDDPRFGLTKLNKLLYLSDFKGFLILGHAFTGATYLRGERGPAAAEMLPELRTMQAEGEAEVEERLYFNLRQRRVKALRAPDLQVFSTRELQIVGDVLEALRLLDAGQVRALSHLEVAWQITPAGEAIPYHSGYISDRQPTALELARRKQAVHGQWPAASSESA